jgi:hypothetical protein
MAFNRTIKELNRFGCSKLHKNNTDVMSCQVTTCIKLYKIKVAHKTNQEIRERTTYLHIYTYTL